MSRNKSLVAVLALAAIVGFGTQLQAANPTNVKVILAGSSAQWQTLALGTFGGLQSGSTTQGNCGTGIGATAPCFHYTDSGANGTTEFGLVDERPATANTDLGPIWIVWDSASPANVWAFVKVDSGVGNRCYFANPACYTFISAVPAASNNIASALWGSDTALPAAVASLFTSIQGTNKFPGVQVTVSATDIRPEDSLWSTCRTNSQAGQNAFDTTDGLGYNQNFKPGVCAQYPAATTAQGNAVKSGYPNSSATANVLGWNITGKDPFTGLAVPKYTTYSVGIDPVVFIFSRNGGQLNGLQNVTEDQLDQLFSGQSCNASTLGLSSNQIVVALREPLSGTMNTTEASVFRRPVVALGGALGTSQEYNAVSPGAALANPLAGGSSSCVGASSTTGRFRGIGTGEVVNWVANSVTGGSSFPGVDAIAYAFFSYGNVKALWTSSKYGYVTLNGVDPIFQNYNTSTTTTGYDPGQPINGELPGTASLPSACASAFPCAENQIWTNQLSFPNVRSGTYQAWSLLRIVGTGAGLTAGENVVKASQSYVVTTTPDYIPAVKVTVKNSGGSTIFVDPGATLIRSHYQQVDGTGTALIGGAPVDSGAKEAGGDMGGCILQLDTPLGAVPVTATTTTQLIQYEPGQACQTRANPF